MLESGISPVTLPENDTEARRHPNIAYSMFGRPKSVQVILNGEYTFDATLRDDWTPQIVIPPYYKAPVHTIRIRIDSISRDGHGGYLSGRAQADREIGAAGLRRFSLIYSSQSGTDERAVLSTERTVSRIPVSV